ncbi:MAG: hypothetical protein AAF684_04080 [Pseudomonadota bacterium]
MRRTSRLFAAFCLLAPGPAAAVDGLFLRGGAAMALVDTIDGVIVSSTDSAELDQEVTNGVAIDLALGYRSGRYALALQGGYARNGLGRSTATFASDGAVSIVEQSGTFQRFNLGLTLDTDLARIPLGGIGVSARPFVSVGLGYQWARFRYDERTNSLGQFSDGRFAPSQQFIGTSGLGLGFTLPNGWDAELRYTAALVADARFEGEGTQTGATLGFAQLQQNIGVGLSVPLATLLPGRDAGRRPRDPTIDPLGW